jgi:hypothetical protein
MSYLSFLFLTLPLTVETYSQLEWTVETSMLMRTKSKKKTVKQKPQYFSMKKPTKLPKLITKRWYSETRLKQTPT